MNKTTVVVILAIVLSVGALVATKAMQFQTLTSQAGEQPPAKVTFAETVLSHWENKLSTVGSLAAVDGIVVAAEEPGKIETVAFTPGGRVASGDLLVQQDISIEQAQLRSAEATAELANNNLRRIQRLIKQNSASISDLETAQAEARKASAQLDEVKARITKKSIRAPFGGRLGVRQVSQGQDLRVGDPVVILQKLDPILVNFYMPQRQLHLLALGLPVQVTLEDQQLSIKGEITAINPEIDPATRNVRIQARINNPNEQLLPGMYVSVDVVLPEKLAVIAIPKTAILYAPFGNTVFVIEDNPDTGSKTVRQQIITTGRSRGDYVEITSGLNVGETIVTTGAFKLVNGQPVEPDNSMAPQFELNPKPKDS